METQWKHRIQTLEKAHLVRTLRATGTGPAVQTAEGEKLIFCANDYLGLASHGEIIEAARIELSAGLGAGASRMVSGNYPWHETLEQRFAALGAKDGAVYFPSGYQANVGALSALTTEDDIIFSDQLCHASIIDGCRLSRAKVNIFDHNNVEHLTELLRQNPPSPTGGRLIVTEGIFSMDGDMPPLAEICQTAKNFGAAVYLDEAHSIGIIGPGGRGLAAALNLQHDIDIWVGTFGKAIGVSGAAVACNKAAERLLKSTARSLMYTTAPPPCLARAVCKSLDIIERADDLRQKLNDNISFFAAAARDAHLPLGESVTPIQPVFIGDAARVMEISSRLWERGLFVQGIRPPTVPRGTERLRITLSAAHTENQILRLVSELSAIGDFT